MEITNKIVEKHGLNQEEYESIKKLLKILKPFNLKDIHLQHSF